MYSTGTNVWTHSFTTPGNKTITAWVMDAASQTISQDIFVTIH
jgi:hypothetical protein